MDIKPGFHQSKMTAGVTVTVRIAIKSTDLHQVMFLEKKVAVMTTPAVMKTLIAIIMHMLAPVLLVQEDNHVVLRRRRQKVV